MFKTLVYSSILATWPGHRKLLDSISHPLTILDESRNYEVPHCGAFSTPHSHPPWAQIFVSGSGYQIPLACAPPLLSFLIREENQIQELL